MERLISRSRCRRGALISILIGQKPLYCRTQIVLQGLVDCYTNDRIEGIQLALAKWVVSFAGDCQLSIRGS